jgi:hypothetical protein
MSLTPECRRKTREKSANWQKNNRLLKVLGEAVEKCKGKQLVENIISI